MSHWLEGRVAGVRAWTDTLFSLAVDVDGLDFTAGQFARLALPAPPGSKEPMLGRPYSFVNPPHERPHEFYLVLVPGGPLTPRLRLLQPGEPVWLLDRANGFFTLDEVPEASSLWCLASGTGIGPYLSMLRTDDAWTKFERVVLVHAVRLSHEVTYGETIAAIAHAHPGAFRYVPVVSREDVPGALRGRIPALIDDGRLEAAAGVPLAAESSHVMLCGNPQMVADTQALLITRGMKRHRRREPGQVTVETYW